MKESRLTLVMGSFRSVDLPSTCIARDTVSAALFAFPGVCKAIGIRLSIYSSNLSVTVGGTSTWACMAGWNEIEGSRRDGSGISECGDYVGIRHTNCCK